MSFWNAGQGFGPFSSKASTYGTDYQISCVWHQWNPEEIGQGKSLLDRENPDIQWCGSQLLGGAEKEETRQSGGAAELPQLSGPGLEGQGMTGK